EWRTAVSQSGLTVLYADARSGSSEPYLLHHGAGVVLGKLFTRASSEGEALAVPLTLGARATASIIATGGRQLIDDYWGRYVAFLRDSATRTTWILRDPTGGLPCLTTSYRGVDVYFSLMEDGARLGLAAF